MGSLLVNLVSAIQMDLLTSTVMLMAGVLVNLTTLDKNATVAMKSILAFLLANLASVIQVDLLTSTAMPKENVHVKLVILDKSATNA